MQPNYDPYLVVVEYGPDRQEKRKHRVLGWTDDGTPLIPGRKRLEAPPWPTWVLQDEDGPEYSATERRARAALDRLMGGRR